MIQVRYFECGLPNPSSRGLLICDECGQDYLRESEMKEHIRQEHKAEPVRCVD